MKIIYKNGFFDLAAPVYMSDNQKEKFLDFMKKNFDDVEVFNREEASRPGPHGGERRKWTEDDIAVLLAGGSISEKAQKLGRSEMSVIMRSGSVVPDIIKWLKQKGEKNFPPSKKLIREYMKEVGML